MANETTTNSSDDVTPTLVNNQIVLVFREANVLSNMVHAQDLTSSPALTVNIPKLATTLSMTSVATGANEADAVANSAISTDVVALTAASKSCYVTLSDILRDSSTVNLPAMIAGELGRTMATDVENSIAALLGGHSTTVGSSGVDLTSADIRAAIAAFRINALEHAERGVIVLHPQQIADLEADLMSGTGASLAQVFSRMDVTSLFGGEAGSSVLGNYVGHFMNVPVFQSALVPLDGGSANRTGAIFARVDGQNSPACAYGLVWKWMPEVSFADAAVNRQNASVWRGRLAYGVAEINDSLGVSIITDA